MTGRNDRKHIKKKLPKYDTPSLYNTISFGDDSLEMHKRTEYTDGRSRTYKGGLWRYTIDELSPYYINLSKKGDFPNRSKCLVGGIPVEDMMYSHGQKSSGCLKERCVIRKHPSDPQITAPNRLIKSGITEKTTSSDLKPSDPCMLSQRIPGKSRHTLYFGVTETIFHRHFSNQEKMIRRFGEDLPSTLGCVRCTVLTEIENCDSPRINAEITFSLKFILDDAECKGGGPCKHTCFLSLSSLVRGFLRLIDSSHFEYSNVFGLLRDSSLKNEQNLKPNDSPDCNHNLKINMYHIGPGMNPPSNNMDNTKHESSTPSLRLHDHLRTEIKSTNLRWEIVQLSKRQYVNMNHEEDEISLIPYNVGRNGIKVPVLCRNCLSPMQDSWDALRDGIPEFQNIKGVCVLQVTITSSGAPAMGIGILMGHGLPKILCHLSSFDLVAFSPSVALVTIATTGDSWVQISTDSHNRGFIRINLMVTDSVFMDNPQNERGYPVKNTDNPLHLFVDLSEGYHIRLMNSSPQNTRFYLWEAIYTQNRKSAVNDFNTPGDGVRSYLKSLKCDNDNKDVNIPTPMIETADITCDNKDETRLFGICSIDSWRDKNTDLHPREKINVADGHPVYELNVRNLSKLTEESTPTAQESSYNQYKDSHKTVEMISKGHGASTNDGQLQNIRPSDHSPDNIDGKSNWTWDSSVTFYSSDYTYDYLDFSNETSSGDL